MEINDSRLKKLIRELDAQARTGAEKFLPAIRDNQNNQWIDDFLRYRDDFEFAPAAHDVMTEFAVLRAKHEAPAKKLLDEANAAFRQNRRDEGYAKYQQILDKHYAASCYRNVKRWVAARK